MFAVHTGNNGPDSPAPVGAAPARPATAEQGAEMILACGAEPAVFRDRMVADALARDHGISRATAYRYLDDAGQ